MKHVILHNNRVTIVETDATTDAREDLKRAELMNAQLDDLIAQARADVAAMNATKEAIQKANGHKDQTNIKGRK